MKMTANRTETEPHRAGIESTWTEIEALEGQSVGQLKARYCELFGEAPGNHRRLALVRRLAWRLQALAEGELSERARERAQSLARDADLRLTAPQSMTRPRGGQGADSRLPKPGVLLTRSFQGRTVDVEVLDHGFRYDGVVYRSLSAVARTVSGTRWNGYAFFGLAAARSPK